MKIRRHGEPGQHHQRECDHVAPRVAADPLPHHRGLDDQPQIPVREGQGEALPRGQVQIGAVTEAGKGGALHLLRLAPAFLRGEDRAGRRVDAVAGDDALGERLTLIREAEAVEGQRRGLVGRGTHLLELGAEGARLRELGSPVQLAVQPGMGGRAHGVRNRRIPFLTPVRPALFHEASSGIDPGWESGFRAWRWPRPAPSSGAGGTGRGAGTSAAAGGAGRAGSRWRIQRPPKARRKAKPTTARLVSSQPGTARPRRRPTVARSAAPPSMGGMGIRCRRPSTRHHTAALRMKPSRPRAPRSALRRRSVSGERPSWRVEDSSSLAASQASRTCAPAWRERRARGLDRTQAAEDVLLGDAQGAFAGRMGLGRDAEDPGHRLAEDRELHRFARPGVGVGDEGPPGVHGPSLEPHHAISRPQSRRAPPGSRA